MRISSQVGLKETALYLELQDKSEKPTSSHCFLADFPDFGS